VRAGGLVVRQTSLNKMGYALHVARSGNAPVQSLDESHAIAAWLRSTIYATRVLTVAGQINERASLESAAATVAIPT